MEYFILSIKHTNRKDPYITFWRPDNAGYAWPLEWSGRYDHATVDSNRSYYDNGKNTYAVPTAVVEGVARAAVIDGCVCNAVDNDEVTMRRLIAAATS